jgi:hypothetical protein
LRVREAINAEGTFLDWIAAEFPWKKSSAYNFMNVARTFPTVGNELALVDLGALYLLARPLTPPEIRKDMLKRAAGGERITFQLADAALRAATGRVTREATRRSDADTEIGFARFVLEALLQRNPAEAAAALAPRDRARAIEAARSMQDRLNRFVRCLEHPEDTATIH